MSLTVAGSNPLAQYTALRAAISPVHWEALERVARARTLLQRSRRGQPEDEAEARRLLSASPVRELLLPLEDLMRPRVFRPASAFDEQVWVFLLSPSPNVEILAEFARNEILRRWLADNEAVASRGVLVAVVDPEGLTELPTLLTFQMGEQPVSTFDGALYAEALDAAGSGTLATHRDAVASELTVLAEAAALLRQAQGVLRDGPGYVADVRAHFSSHGMQSVEAQARAVDRLLASLRAHSSKHAEIAARLGSTIPELEAFVTGQMRPMLGAARSYFASNQPELTNQELYESYGVQAVQRAEAHWDEGNYVRGGLWYAEGFATALWQGLGDLFTFGHQSTKGDAVEAYREGRVSKDAMEELVDESLRRSLVIGIPTAVLTIATAGLAAPVAAGGGVLRAGLVWGAHGGANTLLSMTAESLYSRRIAFSESRAQEIWQGRQWTPEQIALGTATGIGLGALFGSAGRALELRAARGTLALQPRGPSSSPSGSGAGIQIEEVGPGILRVTQEGHPGVAMLDAEGWRLMLPAGTGMRVVGSGRWPAGASTTGSPLLLGGPGAVQGPTGALQLPATAAGASGSRPLSTTILEPYIGPSVRSPMHLMELHPGARVIGTEQSILPGAADLARFRSAGGIFLPENRPPLLPPSTLDKVYLRFPLPHEEAIRGAGPRVMAEFERLRFAEPLTPTAQLMDRALQSATATAETLPNFAPYALERLKPGGTLEVVFWERSIRSEIQGLLREVHVEPGSGAFRFELVDLVRSTRGSAAPHSGFGIPQVSDSTPVYRAVLRKVPVTRGLLPGGPGISGLPPVPTASPVHVTPAARAFAQKSGGEAAKLARLVSTGEALRARGFDVIVHGEGAVAGELELAGPGIGRGVRAESKRLTAATRRAAQSAIEKGTKQSSFLVVDGTGVGIGEAMLDLAVAAFRRVSLPQRSARGGPGGSGTILLLFGDGGFKIVEY